MERKIIVSDEVYSFLKELVLLLFAKEYFGFLEDAEEYVDKLIDYIERYVGILSGKDAPVYFNRYGVDLKYINYRANRATTWYIFYQQRDNEFQIRHITNNHVAGQYIV